MKDLVYTPPDALEAPRYTGIRSYARCPVSSALDGVDAAVVGIPFDTGTSHRPGARFGPEGIRAASMLIRPFHTELGVEVFGEGHVVVDRGDLAVTPGNAERTMGQIAEALEPVAAAGATPIVLGGDHTVALGELRALAAVHGRLALVLIDAHSDTWDSYYGERYFHGTPFRRAVEEGLVDPTASTMAGLRGSLYSGSDWEMPIELGYEVLTCERLRQLGAEQFAALVRARAGNAPIFLSFDIDAIDPAFAPATGAPEIAGLTPGEAVATLRAFRGFDIRGYDVVEVSPAYDGPGQVTATVAANLAYEFLGLNAASKTG